MIDDTARLDEQQQTAYAPSTDCFDDWNVIGHGLARQIKTASIVRTRGAETSEDYFVAKPAQSCSSGRGAPATVRGN